MKLILALTALLGLCTVSAQAQWVVYDPSVQTQEIINGLQEVAKFIEVINNQVQQIEALTDQLNEFKHYENLFGDPSKILPAAVTPLVEDLRRTELGQTLGQLEATVDANKAMVYTAGGLFQQIGETFKTPDGQTVARPAQPYLPLAAVQKTTDNFLVVSADTAARRVAIKREIAQVTDQLKAASTDAEVQKLTGVLIGLTADLEGTEHEVNQASASALVQDVANRADAQRQAQARKEQQEAEFTEAVSTYGRTFHLITNPVEFPAR